MSRGQPFPYSDIPSLVRGRKPRNEVMGVTTTSGLAEIRKVEPCVSTGGNTGPHFDDPCSHDRTSPERCLRWASSARSP